MANPIVAAFLLLSAVLVSTAVALDPEMISVLSYKANIRVQPFPKMTETTYHLVEGATVNIETNYAVGKDKLFVDYQGKYDIRGTFDSDIGVLFMEGKAPISEYAAALSSIVFTTTAEDGLDRKLTTTFGKNTFYVSSTRHFYEIVDLVHPPWSVGNTACNSRKYMETFQGYLASVGSADELEGIGSKIKKAYWVGAQRDSTDTWRWVTGPDVGEPFWRGKSIYSGGAPYPDEYAFSSWRRFQPNDGGDNLMIAPANAIGSAFFDDAGDLDDVQGYVCEYGGMEDAETASQYQWYTDTTVLRYDCSLLDTGAECDNRKELGCKWSGAICSNSACSGIVTQRGCVANWRCQWNTDGHQGLCVPTSCSKFDNLETCAAPACHYTTVAGAVQCRDAKCYDLASSSDRCSRKLGCNWRGTDGPNTAGRCYLDRSIDCSGSDTVYLLDGTSTMSEEFNKYTSGFFGLTQLLKDADYALTGDPAGSTLRANQFGARLGFVQYGGTRAVATDAAGVGSKAVLTGSIQQVVADLSWHQSAYSASLTTRMSSPGLKKAVDMLGKTNNGRTKVIVLVSTGPIEDARSLVNERVTSPQTSVLKAIEDAGIALIGVTLRSSFPDTPNSNAASSDLTSMGAKVLDITLGEFADRVIYGLCSSKPGTAGHLISTTPKGVDCEDHPDYTTCNMQGLCQWDHSTARCGFAQCLTLNEVMCDANKACLYDKGKTRCGRVCATLDTPGACNAAPEGSCVWNTNGGFCDTAPCVGNINEDSCVSEGGCYFTAAAGTAGKCAPLLCTATDAAACMADTRCAYKNGYCFLDRCAASANAGLCNVREDCAWDVKAAKCRPNECAYYQGEAACAGDNACRWSVDQTPAMCVRAPCSYLAKNSTDNYEAACRSFPQCYWQSQAENGLASICIPKICESNKRSCDCMKMDGCVWRDNQCKNSVFVQCTAADAIFLVESTKAMDRSFSRHPSGVQGVISSIRTWAKAAPIAPSATADGFRLGLVGYGSTGAALYPTHSPCSSGPNSPLCTSVASFVGPASATSSYLDSLASYANGAGDNAGIKRGLEAALDLFRANPDAAGSAKRKRILVVIGNSAVTDGNTMINKTISDLEALGVNIFSILMQRFEAASEREADAASLMGPIASDPLLEHFSYSTIDNFYTSVLDNFCDPTTYTGAALGVSRNGILPCDWLTGATECNIETSCSYDPQGEKKCGLPSQCPNLDCTAIPTFLAQQGFECRHCKLVNGAYQCSMGNNERVPRGVCAKDACTSGSCDKTSCEAVAGGKCFWGNSNICLRQMCTATTKDACNADLGCVWSDTDFAKFDGTTRRLGCSFSECGKVRDGATCDTMVPPHSALSNVLQCKFDDTQSPGICYERRCIYLTESACVGSPFCEWSGAAGQCLDTTCQYTSNEECEMDPLCYWDAFTANPATPMIRGRCLASTGGCQLSPSNPPWSKWSAKCGADAFRTRSRTILDFPKAGGRSCDDVGGSALFEMEFASKQPANTPGLPAKDCNAFCAAQTNPDDCADLAECQWALGKCSPVVVSSCVVLSKEKCDASDMCVWKGKDEGAHCANGIKVCQQTDGASCGQQTACVWRTGANDMTWGRAIDAPVQLVNPNAEGSFPFVTLRGIVHDRDEVEETIDGASVTIEENFQRGKDVLDVAYPIADVISYDWNPVTATLTFTGRATINEYLSAIRYVVFKTSSQRVATRTITYALGAGMFYCSSTGHVYQYQRQTLSWDAARAACGATKHFGYNGYLATIGSDEENALLAAKMDAVGWISGDDYISGVWKFSTGPDSGRIFWTGDSPINGGYAAPGQFANWDTVNNQPVRSSAAFSHPYLNKTGYWTTQTDLFEDAAGYICEFIGMSNDIPKNRTRLGDVAIIGVGGCVPTESCGIHASEAACAADFECLWRNGKCSSGCSILATSSECAAAAGAACLWDTSVVPAICDTNPCAGLGQTPCTASNKCSWTNNGCVRRSGCAQFVDAESCGVYDSCLWSITIAGGQCDARACKTITTESGCLKNPICAWSPLLGCTTSLCKYGTRDVCSADTRCTWNQPDPSVAGFLAGGEKISIFGSGSQRPGDFSNSTDGIVVAIVEGFQSGSDVLTIDPIDRSGTYVGSYNPTVGILTIRVAPGAASTPYDAFGFLQSNIKFYTSSGASTPRLISYTLGGKTIYGTGSRVYYRMANATARNREEAEAVCGRSRFMGIAGRLAKIASPIDNKLLTSVGAYGWIAAVGSGQAKGDVWTWATDDSIFWRGPASLGSPAEGAYAQWAIGEPATGRYAAFMTESGTWKASDGVSVGMPALCEYGGPHADLQLYGTRTVRPVGCFATPCLDLSRAQCAVTTGCSWNIDSCQEDTFCTAAMNITICNMRELCYWDSSVGSCRTAPQTTCSRLRNTDVCSEYKQCEWRTPVIQRDPPGRGGACFLRGCASHPARSACTGDPLCRWDQPIGQSVGSCTNRLCGYTASAQCWADSFCEWNYVTGFCQQSSCHAAQVASGASSCGAGCANKGGVCSKPRCTSSGDKTTCHRDPSCLWDKDAGACVLPGCDAFATESACGSNPNCFFTYKPIRCAAAQCLAHEDQSTCERVVGGMAQCRWSGTACRELTWLERNAPSATASCEKEVEPNLWWLWLLLAIIVIVICLIIWRLYLAYSKGLNFFEPQRRNVKYSPHVQYAADLFEDAQIQGEETNVTTAYADQSTNRPSLNDL